MCVDAGEQVSYCSAVSQFLGLNFDLILQDKFWGGDKPKASSFFKPRARHGSLPKRMCFLVNLYQSQTILLSHLKPLEQRPPRYDPPIILRYTRTP